MEHTTGHPNWLSKGFMALKKPLPILKAQALEKDSIINCDETWCRVKMEDKYKEAYIWCMVNKLAGIVIFFYDEGSRSRKVLADFIADAGIAALQSDAYNVYKHLDDELSTVEHIHCMAHVRDRSQKALLQVKMNCRDLLWTRLVGCMILNVTIAMLIFYPMKLRNEGAERQPLKS